MSHLPPTRAAERARFGTIAGELSGGLLGKVFGLLAFSLAFACAGGAVGYRMPPGLILPLFIVELGLIFAVQALREREGVNIALLYAFSFVSGLTVGPVIHAYVGAGAGTVVIQAAAITGTMTVGLSAYALTTKRNLMALQPFLFVALLGLIVASLVNLFIGGTVLYTLVSWAGAVLFSVLLVFDVNRTRYAADTMGNAVVITLGIYLDIVNLFLFILRILQGGRR
jgi:modulator of FtsH protease